MILLNLVPIIRIMKRENVCLTCGDKYMFYDHYNKEWGICNADNRRILLRTKNVKKAMKKFLN